MSTLCSLMMELHQKWNQRQYVTNQESESLRTPNQKQKDSTSLRSTRNIHESALTITQEPHILGAKIKETLISGWSLILRRELGEPSKPRV